jgi:hypothetical protein
MYYAFLAENVEAYMDRRKINGICAKAPLILSWTAFVWVLGNLAGTIHTVHRGGDEGLGFHVFWLLILAQMPFFIGYLITAQWSRRSKVTARIVLQVAALVVAFSPVAYFHL